MKIHKGALELWTLVKTNIETGFMSGKKYSYAWRILAKDPKLNLVIVTLFVDIIKSWAISRLFM